jgi:hypothetical protein
MWGSAQDLLPLLPLASLSDVGVGGSYRKSLVPHP